MPTHVIYAPRAARAGQMTIDAGTIREKYNMVLGNADVKITAGYKQNVIGFGWTNGVYLRMRHLIEAGGGCNPVSSSAPAAAAR